MYATTITYPNGVKIQLPTGSMKRAVTVAHQALSAVSCGGMRGTQIERTSVSEGGRVHRVAGVLRYNAYGEWK